MGDVLFYDKYAGTPYHLGAGCERLMSVLKSGKETVHLLLFHRRSCLYSLVLHKLVRQNQAHSLK
jgi:hypothetical protein